MTPICAMTRMISAPMGIREPAKRAIRPFVIQDFLRLKNEPFSQKADKHNLMRLKTEQFHYRFFELQFDTATLIIQTLIIQSFRMIKATGCKHRFKSDLLYVTTWYLVGLGFTCGTLIQL